MIHWLNTHFWADLIICLVISVVLSEAWIMLFVYCLCTMRFYIARTDLNGRR